MYWGHMKSKDLVFWEHLPIALAPSEEYDKDGCFSGSAVDNNGVLTLVYTGNVWLNEQQTELKQVQCMATSTNGITFNKYQGNPIIESPPEVGSSHFRDPKVWKKDDTWYMVLGTRKADIGKVLLYESKDLINWKYINVLAESDGSLGYMWECPDVFQLDGADILLFSPQGIEAIGDRYNNLYQTGYFVGNLDYEKGTYVHTQFEEFDKGFDFYAAQTFLDDKGRRILIGWMDMWEAQMPTKANNWAGAMTIPREISLGANKQLLMKPIEELKQLRSEHFQNYNLRVADTYDFNGLTGQSLEIIVTFSINGNNSFNIYFKCASVI